MEKFSKYLSRASFQSVAAIVFSLILTVGCRSKNASNVKQSPDSAYQGVEQQFISGDLVTAEQTAKATFHRFEGEPIWNATFRIELAKIYIYQGETEKATTLLRQPFPKGIDPQLVIRQELLLAMAEARLGHVQLCQQALARAETLHPAGSLHAELQGMQGSVALAQGRLDQAQSLFQAARAEDHRQNAKFDETQMSMNLGVVALQLEHYEDALQYFYQASTLAESIGARQASEKALGNLGWTYYQTGDFRRALQNAEEARKQANTLGATLDEVRWLTNVGMSQFQISNLAAARLSFEHSLKLAEALPNVEQMQIAHVRLAYLLISTDPSQAAVHVQQAAQIALSMHDTVGGLEPALLNALLLVKQNKTQEAEHELSELESQAKPLPWVQWAAENTLAGLYANTGRNQDADRWFQRAIDTFHRQRLSLKSVELELPFLENGSDLYLGYMEHLIHTGRSEQALQVLDQSRAETLAEGLGVSTGRDLGREISARSLAARLHGTILVYCLRPGASYLWASMGAKQQMFVLPGSEALLPLIARHTEAILASKDLLAQSDPPGRALYDALLKPAESFLQPGSRVFIIGDKELSGLNFETLISARDRLHYWIEDATVINAKSLRVLAASSGRAPQRTKQEMLLIGDPIYHAEEYAALPNAAAEMTRVASHFPGDHSSIFSGAHASPLLYTRVQPSHFSYIHFVAHATANETNPLDSAIILSDEAGTTRLYARDILKQPLSADLVTLSSCYGSGIRNYSGEGVVGLVWAFLRAGAHSVIGAMWEVSDVSTPELMDNMYTQLLAGSKPDSALRSAKLEMLHSGGVFRKPLYWASFQLYSGR